MFQVIDLDTNEAIQTWNFDASRNEIRLFATGAEAAQHANDLTAHSPGKKFQPRPFLIDSAAWQQRERDRFQTGFYAKPVWFDAAWYQQELAAGGAAHLHFCHISSRDNTRVAYTATEEKGAQDIQTPARPGSYLKKFFAHNLSDAEIQYWTLEHETRVGGGALKFATTPEEIDRVYRTGPRSCMNNKNDFPRILNRDIFPIHPAQVYAAGDLALAYISQGAAVSARCIVWPSKKLYGRIYGNGSCYSARLAELLAGAGYTMQGDWNFEGARLLKIRNDYFGNFEMPYIDGSSFVYESECGKFFIIGRGRGESRGRVYSCSNTSGTTQSADEYNEDEEDDERPCCEHCEERYDEGEGAYIRDRQEYWCESCADSDAVRCDATGEYNTEDYVTLADGITVWSMRHYESHGFSCEDCNEIYHCDDSHTSEHDDMTRCEECHATHEEENAPPPVLWRIAAYSIATSAFVGYIALDWKTGIEHGTEQEAREVIARISVGQIYYRYEAQEVSEDSEAQGELPLESRNVAA